jgi:hypothetical protein
MAITPFFVAIPGQLNSAQKQSMADAWRTEHLAQQGEERRALDDAKADAAGVRALAEFYLPPDLQEWGIRNRIPEFAKVAWISAFVEGWRAANRAIESGKGTT